MGTRRRSPATRGRGARRPAQLVLIAALASAIGLRAQTIERTDAPKAGNIRLTFDPRILTWDQTFSDTGLVPLGAPLQGDTIGSAHIPVVANTQRNMRTASGLPTAVASIGQGLFFTVFREQRITPVTAELGLTDRLSLSLSVPLVRAATRTALHLGSTGANLGLNPLATGGSAPQQYTTFFAQFGGALTQLGDSLSAGGHYGCPGSPACAQAQQLLAHGQVVFAALHNIVYGVGAPGSPGSPFVPLASSGVGAGINSTISGLQDSLSTSYHVAGFTSSFLLSTDTLADSVGTGNFEQLLQDSTYGFGYQPFRDTFRYGLGNIELEAKYRVIERPAYRLALAGLVRLPTASRDTTTEVVDAPIDELGGGFEGRLLQEVSVGRFWLNIAVRGGTQRLGTRSRRLAPFGALLVPAQATTTFEWTGGNYAGIDVAPLYRLAPAISAGLTLGYWTKAADHYAYRSAADSTGFATRLGTPLPASFLDVGTSERWVRLGIAVSYIGPVVEGDFTVEKTLSGAGGLVPDATVYRLVFRVTQKLF